MIYAPAVHELRMGWGGRTLALALSLGALAMLVSAAWVTPSPTGDGTHLQLGLGACGWLDRAQIPCLTCGMTTSTAWFVRGNWLASLYVQPMGFAIALGAAMTFWAGLYVAVAGRPAYRVLRPLATRTTVVALVGFATAAWGWKIFSHLSGIGGW